MESSVKQWMTGNPVSVRPEASALEAHDRMVEFGIRHLPVVGAGNRVVGVLSVDDLRAALPGVVGTRAPLRTEDRSLAREWTVGELMTHAPFTVSEQTSLREAVDELADRRIGCLPVVDAEGKLVGLLSETDALRALATSLWTSEKREGRAAESEFERLVQELRRERERIAKSLDALHATERQLAADLHDEPRDALERGADLRESLLAENFDSLAARRLRGLDRALDRAARGELGTCEACGGRIPASRLRAVPGATLCVACARVREEGPAHEEPFERPAGGRAETGRPELGSRVYTRRFGEGVLLRVTPFGTCERCGDVEGVWDDGHEVASCGNESCSGTLGDVRERAIVAIEEREAYVDPEELRNVDPAPYD
jgi:acetoin utilization protein AcuB